MCKIMSVTPKDNYRLEVVLDDGNSMIVDFTSKIKTIRFSLLYNKDYFNTATTDGAFVRWNYKIEISLYEIMQMAQERKDGG